jgi:hypothetical protein
LSTQVQQIADPTISFYLYRWAAAVSAQAARIKRGVDSKAYFHGNFDSGSGDLWSDSVLLLESIAQFHRWYDHAARRWPSITTKRQPNLEIRSQVADLRKMTIHADDFIQGQGRGTAQSRFIADTPFQHSATTVQIEAGVLVLGGRLAILDAAIDIIECAKMLQASKILKEG